ncbi:MAG: HDOD domain-containing protein, partial [Thermodesulfobacteriota bacterium]|nr:HDOD domain-containing protein [Thermodesulfobacteriota bacterium]
MAPLSHSSLRLMEVMGDEDHSLRDVVRIVESDAVLTAEVLKVVNSAAFGLRRPVDSLARAITFLGEKMIVGIAIGSCAPQVFNQPLDGYESERGELWAHSLRTGIAARELAPMARDEVNPDIAFTAGILHDIGKSVLSEFLRGLPREMVQSLDRHEVQDYLQTEEAAVGVNHCAAGGELAENWKLPQPLRAVILHHHKPSEAEPQYRTLVYVVHLGDLIAMMGGTGTGADTLLYSLDNNYPEFIDIDKAGLEKLMMAVMIEFEKTRALIEGGGKENG